MRNTALSALIVLVIAVVLITVAGIAFATSGVAAGIFWLAILVIWVAYVGLTSFYKIPPDKMLTSFLLGTSQETYVNGRFVQVEKRMSDGRMMTMEEMGGRRGLFNLDVVILLYPIWYGVYFPTTLVKLIIHATTVYLKEHKEADVIKSPGVPVRVKVIILFRLTPDLGGFVQTINVLSRGLYDLAHEVEIRDNLWSPNDANNDRYVYMSPRLAQVVQDAVVETVLHSVRSIASQKYTWKEVGREGGDENKEVGREGGDENVVFDIKGSIPRFRNEVLQDLAEPQSVFCQAGILEPRRGGKNDKVALGPAVLSFDLRVEDVAPENPQFLEALSKPMIADLEAEADKLRGGGEGQRLKEKAEISGVSAEELYRGEVVQKVDNVSVYGAGESITDLVKGFLGRKK